MPSGPSHPGAQRRRENRGPTPRAPSPPLTRHVAEMQAGKILATLGYEITSPGEVWPQPAGSEREACLDVLADRMRYLLRSPRGTNKSVLRRWLVGVSGPREGLVPGAEGRESQV